MLLFCRQKIKIFFSRHTSADTHTPCWRLDHIHCSAVHWRPIIVQAIRCIIYLNLIDSVTTHTCFRDRTVRIGLHMFYAVVTRSGRIAYFFFSLNLFYSNTITVRGRLTRRPDEILRIARVKLFSLAHNVIRKYF